MKTIKVHAYGRQGARAASVERYAVEEALAVDEVLDKLLMAHCLMDDDDDFDSHSCSGSHCCAWWGWTPYRSGYGATVRGEGKAPERDPAYRVLEGPAWWIVGQQPNGLAFEAFAHADKAQAVRVADRLREAGWIVGDPEDADS